MASTSVRQRHEFAPTVLRGLAALAPFDPAKEDLALELGLSAWIRLGDINLDDARSTLLHIRSVLLEAGRMDSCTEPIPIWGRSPRLDVLSLASYLGTLVARAASSARCDPGEIIERSIERLSG